MQSLISICAWCDSVKTSIGWMEAVHAFQMMGIDDDIPLSEMTHGICPSCAEQWTKIDKQSFEHACRQEAYASSLTA